MPYLKDAINCFQVTTVKRTYEATELLKNEHNLEILKPTNLYKMESSYGIKINDSKKEQRHIRFDFDMDLLEENFKKNEINCDITNAWEWTRIYFENLGYKHEQGSVYSSPRKMTDTEIIGSILSFSQEYDYLAESFKSFQITSIGRTYDITDLANGKGTNDEVKEKNEVQKEEQVVNIDNGFSL